MDLSAGGRSVDSRLQLNKRWCAVCMGFSGQLDSCQAFHCFLLSLQANSCNFLYCIYFITVMIYFWVLTVCNTLYKLVNTQRDGFCPIHS